MSTETERTSSPLQRAWDTAMLQAWQRGDNILTLRTGFSAEHLGGQPVTKALGLRRLPMDTEIGEIPVTVWMNEAGLEKIAQTLLKRNLHRAGAAIPADLFEKITTGTLDCKMTAAEGKARRDALRDIIKEKRISLSGRGSDWRRYPKSDGPA